MNLKFFERKLNNCPPRLRALRPISASFSFHKYIMHLLALSGLFYRPKEMTDFITLSHSNSTSEIFISFYRIWPKAGRRQAFPNESHYREVSLSLPLGWLPLICPSFVDRSLSWCLCITIRPYDGPYDQKQSRVLDKCQICFRSHVFPPFHNSNQALRRVRLAVNAWEIVAVSHVGANFGCFVLTKNYPCE